MIKTSVKAARAAGKILLKNYNKEHDINVKDNSTFVTEIDIACEKKIGEIILSKYPDHCIIGEEGGEKNKGSDHKWIIDPLDGTHNYIYRLPLFGVSIGYAYKDELVMGVVYMPLLKELYTAEKGKGCFLNGEKMLIKDKPLKESAINISPSHIRYNLKKSVKNIENISKNCKDIRVFGCAVFSLTNIVKNSFGGVISQGYKDWDVAASVVMIREAGGLATDFKGNDWSLGTKGVIAGNKSCNKRLVELLK